MMKQQCTQLDSLSVHLVLAGGTLNTELALHVVLVAEQTRDLAVTGATQGVVLVPRGVHSRTRLAALHALHAPEYCATVRVRT